MAFNSETAQAGIHTAETQMNFLAALANWGRKAATKFGAGVQSIQVARMMSTLSNMSDVQLAQIGISRSEIPQYAETLMKKS